MLILSIYNLPSRNREEVSATVRSSGGRHNIKVEWYYGLYRARDQQNHTQLHRECDYTATLSASSSNHQNDVFKSSLSLVPSGNCSQCSFILLQYHRGRCHLGQVHLPNLPKHTSVNNPLRQCFYPKPDSSFNIDNYLGRWYQVAGSPAPYTTGCTCIYGEYALNVTLPYSSFRSAS